MKPEHQRIKIAEACGFLRNNELDCWEKNNRYYFNCGDSRLAQLPDYLNDLNAMVQAVKTLPHELLAIYMHHLFYVLIRVKGEEGVSDFDKHTAEPEHYAEAFLKTLRLWEEKS